MSLAILELRVVAKPAETQMEHKGLDSIDFLDVIELVEEPLFRVIAKAGRSPLPNTFASRSRESSHQNYLKTNAILGQLSFHTIPLEMHRKLRKRPQLEPTRRSHNLK